MFLICPYRFILGRKYAVLVSAVDNGGDYARQRTGGGKEISVLL